MKRLTACTLPLVLISLFAVPVAPAGDGGLDLSLHTWSETIGWYPANRVNDLFDIPTASIGLGLGYGLEIAATTELGLQMADYNTCRWGWNQGGVLPQVWDKEHSGAGMSLGPFSCGSGLDGQDPAALAVGLHVGVIGASAGVDLYETLDAVFGLLLIDLSGDDEGATWRSYENPY